MTIHSIASRTRAAVLALMAGLACCLLAAAGPAAAQNWPTKPVKIIVGFPAGTSPDLVARTLADLDGADAVARRHVAEALSYRQAVAVPEMKYSSST